MLLRGFFDDSGSHKESAVYVLAGVLAPLETWNKFEKEWSAILRKDPAITCLHTADANALDKEFKNIPVDQKDAKLVEFAKLLLKFDIKRIDTSILRKDFEELVPETTPDPNFKDPYFLLFYKLITSLVREPSLVGSTLELCFDTQGRIGNRAVAHWDCLTLMFPREFENVSRPIHGSDIDYVSLQAADMYAWHVRKNLIGQLEGRLNNPHRHVDEIFYQLPHLSLPMQRDEIVRHAASITLTAISLSSRE